MKGLDIRAMAAPWPAKPALDQTWPSRIDLKHEPIDTVAELLMASGLLSEDERPWLVLCLDEAIVNAMLHGNEGDPSLPVRIVVDLAPDRWTVLVADQGDGFDQDHVPDPDDPASLMLEHGRGIRIMREWLDRLTWYQGGSVVLLERRRHGRN